MNRTRTAALLTLAVAALSVTACGIGGGGNPTKTNNPQSWASDQASGSAAPEVPSVAKIGGAQGFTYDDKVQVIVPSAKRWTPTGSAAGIQPGQKGVKVTVKIVNGSDQALDLAAVQVNLKAGADGVQAESIIDFESQVGSGFTGSVAPGRSASAVFGFAVAPANLTLLNVEVTPSYAHRSCVFEGAAS